MATAATVTADLGGSGGHVIPPYYSDFLRMNLYPSLYFRQLGTKVTIPRGYGDKIKIPRWQTPIRTVLGQAGRNTAICAIAERAEGVTTTALYLCAESITGQTVQYDGARGYSDKLILVTKANWIEGALESLTRELAFYLDSETRRQISASSVLRIAGSQAVDSAKTTDGLFGKNIAKIAPYMDAHNVPRWEDNSFVAVANPLGQYDVFRDISATGFVPVARYNDASMIYRGEVGQMYGVRLVLSNAVPRIFGRSATSAANGISAKCTGSNAYIFAPDAFYSIEQEDGGVEVIHHPPGSSGSVTDPTNKIGSVAVKVHYGVAAAPQADQRLMRYAHGLGLGY